MEKPKLISQKYGTLSKLELCKIIQKQLPAFTFVDAPIGKDPDQRNYIVSNEKIEAAGYKAGDDVVLGLDAASTEFFEGGRYKMEGEGKTLDAAGMGRLLQAAFVGDLQAAR